MDFIFYFLFDRYKTAIRTLLINRTERKAHKNKNIGRFVFGIHFASQKQPQILDLLVHKRN